MVDEKSQAPDSEGPLQPPPSASADFYAALPMAKDFHAVVEMARYAASLGVWRLGLADVVTSTEAIEAGRYKAVNTAGAAVISAVSNALGTLDFPFVFTGDGASFAVGRATPPGAQAPRRHGGLGRVRARA